MEGVRSRESSSSTNTRVEYLDFGLRVRNFPRVFGRLGLGCVVTSGQRASYLPEHSERPSLVSFLPTFGSMWFFADFRRARVAVGFGQRSLCASHLIVQDAVLYIGRTHRESFGAVF